MKKDRILWIDISKGIGIILVVIGHVVESYHNSNLYLDNSLFKFLFNFVYSFHMPFFMIISGYLLSKSRNTGSKKSRVLKLLINYGIPYIFFSTLFIVMQNIMSNFVTINKYSSINELFLIFIKPKGFNWYLYALLIMHLICIIIPVEQYKFYLLIISLLCHFIYPFSKNYLDGTIIPPLLNFYLFFMVGYCSTEFITCVTKRKLLVFFAISGTILLLGDILLFEGLIKTSSVLRLFISISGSLCLITFSILISKWNLSPILSVLGKYSLPIYGLHALSISFSRHLLTRFHLNTASGILPLIICTILGTGIPYIVYLCSTKIWNLEFLFYPGKYIKIT